MSNKVTYTEKNIEKLINSSFKKEDRLNEQHKAEVLNMLLHKVARQKKESQPENIIVIGLSIVWIIIPALLFSEFKISLYMLDFIKAALGLGVFLIPVASIILIILKWRFYGKKVV